MPVWLWWNSRELSGLADQKTVFPERNTDRRIHSCHSPVGNTNCNENEGDNRVEQCRHYIANSPMKETKHTSKLQWFKRQVVSPLLASSFLLWAPCQRQHNIVLRSQNTAGSFFKCLHIFTLSFLPPHFHQQHDSHLYQLARFKSVFCVLLHPPQIQLSPGHKPLSVTSPCWPRISLFGSAQLPHSSLSSCTPEITFCHFVLEDSVPGPFPALSPHCFGAGTLNLPL